MSAFPPDVMERLQAKAEARAVIVNDIARILWESGEMLADTEGGAMPSWEEVTAGRADDGDQEYKDACWAWCLDHTHKAEALLRVDAPGSLALAKYLIDSAVCQQSDLELQLWQKIERAKGFEPGSLTGAPGVPQKIAL